MNDDHEPETNKSDCRHWKGLEVHGRNPVYDEIYFRVPLNGSDVELGLRVICIKKFGKNTKRRKHEH